MEEEYILLVKKTVDKSNNNPYELEISLSSDTLAKLTASEKNRDVEDILGDWVTSNIGYGTADSLTNGIKLNFEFKEVAEKKLKEIKQCFKKFF